MTISRRASLPLLAIVLLASGCGERSSAIPDDRPQQPVAVRRSVTLNPLIGPDDQLKNPRYLIIHADDAGLCSSVNRATIEALEEGVVSSVSMMVPCPAFEEFAAYARKHPEYDYGIHLTLNAEFRSYRWGPVLPRKEVPGLIDPQGYLWAEEKQTAANARADEVERELSAQIDRALALKVPISHLDSHMGTLFTRPDLLEVYVNLGIKYKLPVLFVRTGDALRLFPVFRGTDSSVQEIAEKLARHQLPVLDRLYMHYVPDTLPQKFAEYRNIVRGLQPGVSELIVHCGYADSELYNITGSAPMRDGDRRILTDPRFRRELNENGIRILNWKQFREMTQSSQGDAPDNARPARE
ncbi:MAG: polysaccharide deacetylase family protein [Planctomycetaceae bacterium]